MKKRFFTFGILFSITACGNKAIVNVYDKSIQKTSIPCLKLILYPPNAMIEKRIKQHYRFTNRSCPYRLEISYKNGIACNSTQNVQTKSINGFPSSYLKMEIRKGFSLQYSYYIDLMSKVDSDDIDDGFKRLEEDLKLER